MLDLAIPYQMYPECDIVTKFNIDVDSDFFILNDLKFSFPEINMSSASVLWKQFRSTHSVPLVKNQFPKLVRYNYEKDYLLVNSKLNMFNMNLSSYKFKSQLTINNDRVVTIYDGRIVVCTLDGNIIPFKDYTIDNPITHAFFEYDGEYLYVVVFTAEYYEHSYYLVFSDYRDLRKSKVYSTELGQYSLILDYDEDDKTLLLYGTRLNDRIKKIKLTPTSVQTIYSHNMINYIIWGKQIPSNTIVPKTMYNYGIYTFAVDDSKKNLYFINIDEYNNAVHAFTVEITYNGFPEINKDEDIKFSFISNIVNNQCDLIIVYNEHTDCYRIKLDDTYDLVCQIIGYTKFNESFDFITRISTTRPDLIAGVQNFKYSIFKYLSDLGIYDFVERFNTTNLAFFTLKNEMTYYITHDEYTSDNANYTEIRKRQILPITKLYINTPQFTEPNTLTSFKIAAYDLINEKFVENLPIDLVIKQNGHFANGKNHIWFLSQDHETTISFYSEDSNKAIDIDYSIKGSQYGN